MTQQIINTGEVANDGTGESLRDAFNAVNQNFTQIWAYGPVDTQVVISGNQVSTNQINLDLVLAGNGIGNIAVASTVVPTTDSVYDLGSPTRYFDTIYGRYFYGNGRFLTGIQGGGGSGSNVTFSMAPPLNPQVGDIWIESDTGVQYLYFNDDTSSQWAEMEAYISFSSANANGGGNINLTDIQSNVLPSVSNLYQLGTSGQQWKTLFVSGNVISIANTALAIHSGVLSVGGSNVLTEGSPLTFTNLTVSNSATIGNRATIGNIYSDHYYYANGVPFGQGGGNLGNSIITAKENVLSVSVENENLVLAGNGIGNIQANSSIIPSIDSVYDVGSPLYQIDTVYARYFVGNGRGLTGIVAPPVNTGNWGFVDNTIYNINGGSVNNSDLVSGATAGLNLPTNGVANSDVGLFNLYGNIILQTGNNTGYTTATWIFGETGNITLPSNTANINYANGVSILSGVSATPGGTNTQVQFNDDNVFGGHPNFTFDKDTDTLQVPANLIVNNIYSVDSSTVHVHDNLETFGTMTAQGYYLTDGGSFISSDGNLLSVTAHANLELVTGSGNGWLFGSDGNLTIPDSGTITVGTGNLNIESPSGFVNITSKGSTFVFDNSVGRFIMPVNGLISGAASSAVTIESGPGNFVFEADGNLTLPTNNSSVNYANGQPFGTMYTDANVVSLLADFGSNTISTTGNITGGNFLGAGPNVELVAGSYTWTFDNTSTLSTPGNITTTANITGGNFITTGIVHATTVTNENGTLTIQAGSGYDLVLDPVSANISVSSNWINNLADPVQAQDAATKKYVDDNSAGLNIHTPVLLASTQDLAAYTGATVNYDNGVSGVGATLSLVGNTLTTLDNTSITGGSSTRLLIKNQGNAVQNGIYTYTSSSLLTRATDMDQPAEITGGDYVFVQSGSTQASSSWVEQNNIADVGTDDIVFIQFSASQSYSAGNALALNGSQFNVKVDNFTIDINGSNQLEISPTATISTSGNITGGNILSPGIISSGGNTYQSNVIATGYVTATGNITGNYFIGNGSHLTGFAAVAFTGDYANLSNVPTDLNQFTNGPGYITSATANVISVNGQTGVVTVVEYSNTAVSTYLASGTDSSNIVTTGNVSGAYILGNGSQLTGFTSSQITTALGYTPGNGNGTVTNIQGNGIVAGLSLTGNVTTAGNLTLSGALDLSNVTGNISTTGNIIGNYIIGNGSQLTGLPAGYSNANVATYLASGTDSSNIITTGNVSGTYILGNGSQLTGIYSFSTVSANGTSLVANSLVSTLTVTPGNNIIVTGNATSNTVTVATSMTPTFTTVSATGNITGNYILGNGSLLTGVVSSYSNSNVTTLLAALGANTISSTGNITTTANISGGNIIGTFVAPGANTQVMFNDAGVIAGNANMVFNKTVGNLSVTGNIISSGDLWAASGNIRTGATTANIVNSTPTTVNIAGGASIATNIGNASGIVSLSGNVQGNTNGFAIGYRDIPQVTFNANATIVLSDAGKHYYSTSASNLTMTIANSTTANFAVGAAINLINQGTGTITVAQGSGVTMYFAGNSTAGNRTVASYGVATIQKVATDTWFIVGVGIT